jgi:flavin reductase (DIM6/NTAB) family NADH-FMN oxidoreductase RutF
MLTNNSQIQEAAHMPTQQPDFDPSVLNNVHALHETSVKPSAETEREYRDALGRFSTGVTLITARTEQGPIGMTVNSFASVSLDPALVLWSIAKKSGRYDAFRYASHFVIHILAKNQLDLAMAFAKDAHSFEGNDWDINDENIPLAKKALARFECESNVVHDGGDHSIVIGRVKRFSQRLGAPLIFNAGKFGAFLGNDSNG